MKDYYYILGIQKSATPEEIKTAYRKLSLRLHPDQNDGDKFFEDRFKDINEAYRILIDPGTRLEYDKKNFGTSPEAPKSPPKTEKRSADNVDPKNTTGDFKSGKSNQTSQSTSAEEQRRPPASDSNSKILTKKDIDRIYVFLGLVSIVAFVYFLLSPAKSTADKTVNENVQPPSRIQLDTLPIFRPVAPSFLKPGYADSVTKKMTEQAISKALSEEIAAIKKKEAKRSKPSYFTIGSTKDEVTSLQGTPTSITGLSSFELWSYGSSTVNFEYGKVRGYNNFDGYLRVRLVGSLQSGSRESGVQSYQYSIGSTKDDVIRIQGTPDAITGPSSFELWSYGSSTITFEHGKVRGFNNFGDNLHIRVKPNP